MDESKRRHATTTQAAQGNQRVMPRFAFCRRLDLEREAGLTLSPEA